MENQVNLKVILNHYEERKINNQLFYVYTLTDYSSGNNFNIWSTQKIVFFDNMKLLLEVKIIKFNVFVNDKGLIKLKPLEVVKGG